MDVKILDNEDSNDFIFSIKQYLAEYNDDEQQKSKTEALFETKLLLVDLCSTDGANYQSASKEAERSWMKLPEEKKSVFMEEYEKLCDEDNSYYYYLNSGLLAASDRIWLEKYLQADEYSGPLQKKSLYDNFSELHKKLLAIAGSKNSGCVYPLSIIWKFMEYKHEYWNLVHAEKHILLNELPTQEIWLSRHIRENFPAKDLFVRVQLTGSLFGFIKTLKDLEAFLDNPQQPPSQSLESGSTRPILFPPKNRQEIERQIQEEADKAEESEIEDFFIALAKHGS